MNLDSILLWIEAHATTIGLFQWLIMIFAAWFFGLFDFVKKYTMRPCVKIVPTASFVFIENIEILNSENIVTRKELRASFIINAKLVNRSKEKIILEDFFFSFNTSGLFRKYSQKLLRLPFPSKPQKKVGIALKYLPVWFSHYPLDGENKDDGIYGKLDPKDSCGGYLLFVSFTFGDWNPKIIDEKIDVRLTGILTTGEQLSNNCQVQVLRDPNFLNEFCPGLLDHISHESTWNHDLSIL